MIGPIVPGLGIRPVFKNRAQMINQSTIYFSTSSWIKRWRFWKIVWAGRFIYRTKMCCQKLIHLYLPTTIAHFWVMPRINIRFGIQHIVNEIVVVLFELIRPVKTVLAEMWNSGLPPVAFLIRPLHTQTQKRRAYWGVVPMPLTPNLAHPAPA